MRSGPAASTLALEPHGPPTAGGSSDEPRASQPRSAERDAPLWSRQPRSQGQGQRRTATDGYLTERPRKDGTVVLRHRRERGCFRGWRSRSCVTAAFTYGEREPHNITDSGSDRARLWGDGRDAGGRALVLRRGRAPAFSRNVRFIRGLIPRVVGVGQVAGMVTKRGGEVDRSGPGQHADDRVAQAGHDLRAVPVRTYMALYRRTDQRQPRSSSGSARP
jgi:hypothetical protein